MMRILMKAVVALALVRMTGGIGSGAMAILYSITYFFAAPLLLGASAHLDRGGRLVSQVSGAVQIGAALGISVLLCWVTLRAGRRSLG
jgi:hypothetical protein